MVVALVRILEEALRVMTLSVVITVVEAFIVVKLLVVAFIVVPLNRAWPNKVTIGVVVEIITPLGLVARKLLVLGPAR